MTRELTTIVMVQRAASGASRWRRISSAMSRRMELGKVTVHSTWWLLDRFLALGDEGDDEEHAGQVGEAARGQWPRAFMAMATVRSGETLTDDCEVGKEGKWR